MSSDAAASFDRAAERRALLATAANPGPEHDLLVTVRHALSDTLTVEVRYVPDKRVLDVAASTPYWHHGGMQGATPEAVAATVLADFNNEVVPRWIQIVVADAGHGHQAAVSDCQPGWDNAALLARLRRL